MLKPVTVASSSELLPFLFASWPEVKRTQMKLWLKHQSVLVNDRPVTQFNHPLKSGDIVSLRTGKGATPKAELPGGIKIIYEDASIVIIDILNTNIITNKPRRRNRYHNHHRTTSSS